MFWLEADDPTGSHVLQWEGPVQGGQVIVLKCGIVKSYEKICEHTTIMLQTNAK